MVRQPDNRDDEELEPQEGDTDYELSEAHGYSDWEPPKRNWGRLFVIVLSIILLASVVVPLFVPLVMR